MAGTTLRKRFFVRAGNDAHISFTSGACESRPMVEIYIGSWDNAKSFIRFNQESDVADIDTPGILSKDEQRAFTVEWTTDGTLFQCYGGEDGTPFISWKNTLQPFPVTHLGLRTAYGATGDWICDDKVINTLDSMTYTYISAKATGESLRRMRFSIRAKNDAHFSFTSANSETRPMFEIYVGSWDNSKCFVRFNQEVDKMEIDTPNILNENEHREFTIEWAPDGTLFQCYGGDDTDPFISYGNDLQTYPVTHIGIRTAYGATGDWICDGMQSIQTPDSLTYIYLPLNLIGGDPLPGCPCPEPFPEPIMPEPPMGWVQPGTDASNLNRPDRAVAGIPIGGFDWVEASKGSVPQDAVMGGQDGGESIYVARGRHKRDLIPGKLLPSHRVVYVAWGGGEHAKESYEVLVAGANSVSWIPISGAQVPQNAIPGGETETGETLYIGRAPHHGSLAIGKVHPSHNCLYIAYGGKEIGFSDYEILVKN